MAVNRERHETRKLIGWYAYALENSASTFMADDAKRMGELCDKLAKILEAEEAVGNFKTAIDGDAWTKPAGIVQCKSCGHGYDETMDHDCRAHGVVFAEMDAEQDKLRKFMAGRQWTKEELAAVEAQRILGSRGLCGSDEGVSLDD